jgi:hypothetical protein
MNKIKENIKTLILNDINNNTINNAHGITKNNIDDFLINPVIEEYISSAKNNEVFEFWTVLREYPDKKEGYLIFYDQVTSTFGLGTYFEDHIFYLAHYKGFISALNGM